MAKQRGRIKPWREGRSYGFIEPEDGSRDVFVHISEIKRIPEPQLRAGVEVEYDVVRTRKGLQARNVCLVEKEHRSLNLPYEGLRSSSIEEKEKPHEYRFLNPYNFVRYLPIRAERADDSPDVRLMGRCSWPPHDRWVGLSGQIDCRAEAVTPLFVSDSEGVTEGKNKHRSYRFFNVDGEKMIPASSLRGSVRSLFEAVTNSRFGVFETDCTSRLEFRRSRAPKDLLPARVVGFREDGGAILELFDCRVKPDGRFPRGSAIMPAAWVSAYPDQVLQVQSKTYYNAIGTHKRVPKFARNGKKRVAALVSKNPREKYKRGRAIFRYFEVKSESIVPASEHNKLSETGNWKKVFGYLYVTGPNIENKHDERLFFRWGDNNTEDYTIKTLPENECSWCCEVEPDVVAEYNRHLAAYRDRNKREMAKPRTRENLPWPSAFVKEGCKLEEGDLLYLVENEQGYEFLLRPVSMPRLPYKNPREALLPEDYHPASSASELSPADRLFGWVQGDGDKGAYAGRVFFSHGTVTKEANVLDKVTLAILSTPKPTTTRFYLIDKSWEAKTRPFNQAGYDNQDNTLRGRKFYRHFGSRLDQNEYQRKPEEKSDQNRTVHGVLGPESEFTFSIRFENLSPVELGALLWTLQLEEGMFHRIGFAKPLGFGSIRVRVDDSLTDDGQKRGLRLLDVKARYQSLNEDGWSEPLDPSKRRQLMRQFKKAMVKRYLPEKAKTLKNEEDKKWEAAFETLENVADLKALLSEPPEKLSIHYPRIDRNPTSKGENFNWFMDNKYETKAKRGEWIELEVPAKEVKGNGLPLKPARIRRRN